MTTLADPQEDRLRGRWRGRQPADEHRVPPRRSGRPAILHRLPVLGPRPRRRQP